MQSSLGNLVRGLAHELKAIDIYDVVWPPLAKAVRGRSFDLRALYFAYVDYADLVARPGVPDNSVARLPQGVS